jgi:uncharacterized protein YecT (DUF1311 family)
MKFVYLLLVLLPTAVLAQASGPVNAQLKYQDELHYRASRVVEAEKARSKEPLCPKATSTVDVNTCYASELGITDGNYITLAGAIGALLRSDEPAPAPEVKAPSNPFDSAEATWHAYREQACNVAGLKYEAGTTRPSIEMGCRLTLTRHHMDELWTVYSDLGKH